SQDIRAVCVDAFRQIEKARRREPRIAAVRAHEQAPASEVKRRINTVAGERWIEPDARAVKRFAEDSVVSDHCFKHSAVAHKAMDVTAHISQKHDARINRINDRAPSVSG